jgi:RHS repeat-associated protein
VVDYVGDLIYHDGKVNSIDTPEGRAVPLDTLNQGFTYQFFYADHLGNLRVAYSVAPNGAMIVQENHYGPMGELLEGISSNSEVYPYLFQGKEREFAWGLGLDDFHARMYDPLTGRMLGIDAVDHYGMSGYTGMANNPISTIDPDGNDPFIAAAIGGIISGAGYTLNAAFAPGGLKANWRLGQFAKSVGIGAISGAFAFGIGEAAAGMSGIGKFAFQTGMHGYIGGFSSVVQGGSFGSGFATGAAGSIVGAATANMSVATQIGASALFSGGVAELSGGNFWQGAAQGAIIAGLNHGFHRFLQDDPFARKREDLAKWAESHWYDESQMWAYDVNPQSNKCNIFCFDGMMTNEMSPYDYPLRAGEWGDENKSIPGWKIVKRPQRGDIGAFKANYVDASGHMGIMRNSQSLIYANRTHVASAPTNVTQWATKQWVYRRYIGKK